MQLLAFLALTLCTVVALSRPRQDSSVTVAHDQDALNSVAYKDRALADTPPRSYLDAYITPPGKYEKKGCKWGGRAGAVCGAVVGGAAYGAVGGALGSLAGPVGAGVGAGAAATFGAIGGIGVGTLYGSRKGASLGKKLDDHLAKKKAAKTQQNPTASNSRKSGGRSRRLTSRLSS
ncbi:hypothetical protein LEN26_013908 [Aphanomyces euteiches]|nr:hypothetical protein LEN26_013908 [Aphanomyces euteiches]KAH9110521.1 hypothetical protein AeMF1_014695 [Aphanomyces euteiches]KAH9166937.1 hypothetical protein AeNC1_018232 [Aphanomyces euteiches]